LFVDTEMGRIYVCCAPCNKKILADVERAYQAAYPTTKKLDNKACPVTGKDVDPKVPALLLQGQEIRLCCPKCAPLARDNSQVALIKANDPDVIDLDNKTCPVTDNPVARNVVVLIGKHLVRLSETKCIEQVKKDPLQVLSKAQVAKQRESKPDQRSDRQLPADESGGEQDRDG
jgi:hypothetical protein